jgi:hypothetical protein
VSQVRILPGAQEFLQLRCYFNHPGRVAGDLVAIAGLAWFDAPLVAAAASFYACTAADPVGSLRRRARAVRAGRGPRCVDSAGVAKALDIAATVLAIM